MSAFQARYPGRCAACDEPIYEGGKVRYEDGFLVHDDCPDPVDHDAPRRTEHRCPDCYATHAGECY